MKKFVALVLFLCLANIAFAVDLTITIPDAKVSRVRDAFKGLYQIPMIPDPDYVLDEEETEEDRPQIPKYTDAQWIKECVKRFIREVVVGYESAVAREAAKETVVIDNDIAQ